MDPIRVPSAEISQGSMIPPGVHAAAAAEEPPKSCLLASKPLVAESTNGTTAIYHPDDSREMSVQASLFVARPPLVSYVLVWCTDARSIEEPVIHSTHGGLILLSMAIETNTFPFSEYYIYQPGRGQGGADAPFLKLVPQLKEHLTGQHCAVGLLSHGDGGGYHVAILTRPGNGEFDLGLFCSKTGTWTIKTPLLLEDGDALPEDPVRNFKSNKVINVGGGVLAFVDLSNGILIGDVLPSSPELHYIPLPQPQTDFPPPWTGYRFQTRDVSFDMSGDTIRIKLVEVICAFTLPAWAAATWITTITAASPWHQLGRWDTHSVIEARQLTVGDGVSIGELLLPEDLEPHGKPNFGFLFVDMPMVSLDEDNVVCFLAKHHYLDGEAWVIAVDRVTKKVLGVHPLESMGSSTTLFYSTISSHLNI